MLDVLAALTKVLLYAGLLAGIGAAFAEATLRGSAADGAYLAQVTRRGALLVIGTSLAGTLILIFRLGGAFDEATLSAVFMSSAGAATALQLAGAVLLLASVGGDPSERTTRLSNAAIAAASFAFSGHAASMGLIEGLIAVLHVSAAAWWTGSLCLLRRACTQWTSADVATLVLRFSTLAVRFIGALVAAGTVLIFVLVDFAREPWNSSYVRMLAVKIALALAMLTLAGYNKYRLTPRLSAGDATAASALRRMIDVELILVGAIIVATAILTTYFAPHK